MRCLCLNNIHQRTAELELRCVGGCGSTTSVSEEKSVKFANVKIKIVSNF